MAEKLVNNTGLSEFAVKIKESVPQFGESSSGQVSKSLIDLFYPVGSYYETSNTSFNPNTAWGGTWVEDSSGKVTAAYQSGDTNFGTVGQTGGEKTHNHAPGNMAAALEMFTNGEIGRAYFDHTMITTDAYQQELRTYTANSYQEPTFLEASDRGVKIVGTSSNSSSLQPYIVVKRWHRTA